MNPPMCSAIKRPMQQHGIAIKWRCWAVPVLVGALLPTLHAATPTRFEITQETSLGQSVFVLGDTPALGGGYVRDALKLSATSYPDWFVEVELPAGSEVAYRFLLRNDDATALQDPANGQFLGAEQTRTIGGEAAPPRSGSVRYFSSAAAPVLERRLTGGGYERIAFQQAAPGRGEGEWLWTAAVEGLPARGDWEFRVDLGGGQFDTPTYGAHYLTALANPWLQDGDLYNYRPAPAVSAPRTLKITSFTGSLSPRPLYIYLPRGYDEHTDRHYPVLYMHDGENIFQSFVGDSTFGQTWRADEAATLLIRQGLVRECIIVGVRSSPTSGIAGENRVREYLPPYGRAFFLVTGQANLTASYYVNEVAPWAATQYRVLPGRENTATCGSSMGGFFSTYLAWDFTDFARHHAALSSAFWITNINGGGGDEVYNRLRTGEPRDVRLYIDSGTLQLDLGVYTEDDDGMTEAFRARDAMLANGYVLGRDFQHAVAYGDFHNETAWAGRFPAALRFLFPIEQEPEDEPVPSRETEGWQAY